MIEQYNDTKFSAVLASAASKTNGVNVSTCDKLTWYVNDSGATVHASHVITLQFAFEDVDGSYQDSEHTITGLGCLSALDIESVKWVRAKVTTTEATSIVDICFDPSREVKRFC